MAVDPWALEAAAGSPAYSGQEVRLGTTLMSGNPAGGALGVRTGIRPSGTGTDLQVAAQAAPNMSVRVFPGCATIQGTASSLQGAYIYTLDATTNLTIGAAHASLTRIDLIAVRIRDSTYDTSGARDGGLVVIAGTPGGGAPSLPIDATYWTLASVTIAALDTTIGTGDISDVRRFTAALGGTIECTSTTRPTTAPNTGQRIFETDTGLHYRYNGTAWVPDGKQRIAQSVLGSTTASVTFSSIPQDFTELELVVTGRSTAAVTVESMFMRINGDPGANYSRASINIDNSLGASGNATFTSSGSQTSANVGDLYGASSADSRMAGSTIIRIPHYAGTVLSKQMICQSAAIIGGTWWGSARFNGWLSAAAVTSVTVFPASGSFVTGTRVTLYGNP